MMVRLDRNEPKVYFGQPGKLIQMPWPKGGIEKPYDRLIFDFVTGSGAHQVSSLVSGNRPYSLNWSALHLDTFAKLSQYYVGANGPGPWVFIDPSTPNLLPANIGAASGLYNDATHMVTPGGVGGIAGSNDISTFIHRTNGWRSIRWRFLTAPIDASVNLEMQTMYRNWYGQPVVPTLPYTFSSWMRVDGTVETNATTSMRMQWLAIDGTAINEVSSGDLSVTSTWQRLSVTGTAPSNAAFVRLRWNAVGSSLTLNGVIYIDEPLWEQDTVVNDWAPSTGIRPVQILSLGETVPFASRFRTGAAMTLRELSR